MEERVPQGPLEELALQDLAGLPVCLGRQGHVAQQATRGPREPQEPQEDLRGLGWRALQGAVEWQVPQDDKERQERRGQPGPREHLADEVGIPKINSLIPPEQKGHHVAVVIFKCIFMDGLFLNFTQISLKFAPKGLIDKSMLVQVMAWRRTGDKPLSEPMLTQFIDAHMRQQGEMS